MRSSIVVVTNHDQKLPTNKIISLVLFSAEAATPNAKWLEL